MIDSVEMTLEILEKRHKDFHGRIVGDITMERFARRYCNVQGAPLYAPLFVPQFVEVESHVFLKDFGIKTESGWTAVGEGMWQAKAVRLLPSSHT